MYDSLRFVHDTCCVSTVITNVLIVYIIIRKTPQRLRPYSIVLFNFAILEIPTAICALLLFIRILVSNEYFATAIIGLSRLARSTKFCFSLISVQMHGHAHYQVLLAFSFCYRYYVINHSPPNTCRVVTALGTAYLPTLCVFTAFAATPILGPAEVEKVISEHFPEYYNESHAKDNLLIVTPQRGAISLGIAWIQYVVFPVYFIIVTMSILVHRSLSSTLKMSETSKKMHREIMRGLIYQSLLPLLFIIAAVYHTARHHRLLPEGEGHLLLTLVALMLALSPLSSLCFIRPYRHAVKLMFSSRTGATTSGDQQKATLRQGDAHVVRLIKQ